jgi:hypothetical protein
MEYTLSPMPWLTQQQGEDGPYHVEVYFVVAVDAAGHRFAHFKTFSDVEAVFGLIQKMEQRGALDPANSPHWSEMEPVYGSDAYMARGGDLAVDRVAFLAFHGMHAQAEAEAIYQDSFR